MKNTNKFRIILYRIRGALLSKKRAAYLAMFYKLLQPITKILDGIFRGTSHSFEFENQKIIFIIGAPRSGTTMLFQHLARSFDINYPTNLFSLFPKHHNSLKKILRLSISKSHPIKNYYGYTSHVLDTYEGNEFLTLTMDPTTDQCHLKKVCGAIANSTAPILFKNVNLYDKLEYLSTLNKNIKFIYISRKFEDNVDSSFRAYRELQYFNPIPPALSNLNYSTDPLGFAQKQIRTINRIIQDQLGRCDRNAILALEYEKFVANKEMYQKNLLQFIT